MKQPSRKTYNILSSLVNHIFLTLDELESVYPSDDFILGQKYAYVECLELLQSLADSSALHIDFVIENKYPLV